MAQRIFLTLVLIVVLIGQVIAQQPVQNVRGIIIDKASSAPVPFANVIILDTSPLVGTVSDSLGNFTLIKVPVGRYDLKFSLIGYEPSIIREISVSSSKELFLTIPLQESAISISEIIVKPNVSKEQPLNSMSTVSARMLSVEEAERYAGGFDDPARLAASFAGVGSNTNNNGIIVRGNAPKFLQWKMEGIEIPNPNHFADLSTFGGGGLTALSSKMLANSDFFTGAFPAEYQNALSGVFDIYMRNGNNQKHEHSFELGLIGIDASSEGPLKKDSRSSYLVNYRYSTLSLMAPFLPENGEGVNYQDLSLKFNFPTKKAGDFSFWGIGLQDGSGAEAKTDSIEWVYILDKETQDVKQFMAATGMSHKIFLNNRQFLKSTVAATANGIDMKTDLMNDDYVSEPENRINNTSWNLTLSSYLNTKVDAKHTNRTGFVVNGLMYDLLLKNSDIPGTIPQTIVDENGFSTLVSAYTNSTINFTNRLAMNIGVNGQLFTLNKNFTIEPRIGFKWRFNPAHSLGLAYGLHSRLEKLQYYFTTNSISGSELTNKDLDFSKAHHFVLSYDWSIKDNTHLKVEPYYQKLFSIPVIADSSFSFINLQNDWFFDEKLINIGEGINYGIDVTLEKYLTKGLYYMFTASLFDSQYKGGDNNWRDTRYNRNYLFNFLIGKEWQFGQNSQKIFGLNFRLSYQGGDHYSPVNESESLAIKDVVLDEYNAFSMQLPASFTEHFTINYKIYKKNTAHIIALKVINATNEDEFYGFQYNYKNNTVDEQREAIFIPNLSYKIEF